MNPKTTRELRRLQTWYNPTLTDMGEVAFVGGTDDLYENPEKFQGAWNHPEEVERKQWRLAILKEFKDMEEKRRTLDFEQLKAGQKLSKEDGKNIGIGSWNDNQTVMVSAFR